MPRRERRRTSSGTSAGSTLRRGSASSGAALLVGSAGGLRRLETDQPPGEGLALPVEGGVLLPDAVPELLPLFFVECRAVLDSTFGGSPDQAGLALRGRGRTPTHIAEGRQGDHRRPRQAQGPQDGLASREVPVGRGQLEGDLLAGSGPVDVRAARVVLRREPTRPLGFVVRTTVPFQASRHPSAGRRRTFRRLAHRLDGPLRGNGVHGSIRLVDPPLAATRTPAVGRPRSTT